MGLSGAEGKNVERSGQELALRLKGLDRVGPRTSVPSLPIVELVRR